MNQRFTVGNSTVKLVSDQKVIFGGMNNSLETIWTGEWMSSWIVSVSSHCWIHLKSYIVTDHEPVTITWEPILVEYAFIVNKTLDITFSICESFSS